MVNRERLVRDFISMVQIDSETGNERAMADELKIRFRELGLEAEEDDSAAVTGCGSGNLYAVMEGNVPGAPAILLSAHMDTVAPGRGILPQIGADQVIRSNGQTILGSDDKAGISVILEGLRIVKEQGWAHGPVEIVITAGEERMMLGAQAFDCGRLRSVCGFVLDASGPVGRAAQCESGIATMDIRIIGKAAHASMPEKGVSAIAVASHAVASVPLGRIDEETVANVGQIYGGTGRNVIAGEAIIAAEARSWSQVRLGEQVELMRTSFASVVERYGARMEFQELYLCKPYRLDEQADVLQLAAKAIRRVERTPDVRPNMGCSDANIFNERGIPTVKLSIGYDAIHSVDEHIPIAELVKSAELVAALIVCAAEA